MSMRKRQGKSGREVEWEKKRAHWQAIVHEWEKSGQTAAEFCRDRDLVAMQFYDWRRRLKNLARKKGTVKEESVSRKTSAFIPVQIVPTDETSSSQVGSSIEITLRGGRSIRVERDFDEEALMRLVTVLEKVPC